MAAFFQKLEVDEAKSKIKEMSFAIGQFISEYKVGTPDEVGNFDNGECLDARYFSDSSEIHTFRKGNDMICVETSDGDREFFDTEYEIENRFSATGKYVVVRNYIDTDEDGQSVVTGTRLVSIKGA